MELLSKKRLLFYHLILQNAIGPKTSKWKPVSGYLSYRFQMKSRSFSTQAYLIWLSNGKSKVFSEKYTSSWWNRRVRILQLARNFKYGDWNWYEIAFDRVIVSVIGNKFEVPSGWIPKYFKTCWLISNAFCWANIHSSRVFYTLALQLLINCGFNWFWKHTHFTLY